MSLTDSLVGSEVRSKLSQRKKIEERKLALLEDPKKLDDYVGRVVMQLSPSKRKSKDSSASFLTDRVDKAIPSGHPMKGIGEEFKEIFANEISSEKNRGYSTKEIASGIVRHLLEQPDDEGVSRLERAYRAQREQQTSWFGMGEDKNLKAPAPLPGMITYKQWREGKNIEEKKKIAEGDLAWENYPSSIVKAASTVGTISGGAALVGSLIGPQAIAAPITAPLATAIGAIAGGVGEAIAFPVRRLIRESEWGRSREFSGKLTDAAKLLALDIGVDLATMGPPEMSLLKSVKMADHLKIAAVAKPTAENVTKAATAEKEVVKKGRKVAKAAVKKDPDVEVGERLAKLSKEGQVEATAHPGGLRKGIDIVEERERALALAEGRLTPDELVAGKIKKVKREDGKKQKTSTDVWPEIRGKKEKVKEVSVLKEASEEIGKEWNVKNVPVRAGGGDEATAAVLKEQEKSSGISYLYKSVSGDTLASLKDKGLQAVGKRGETKSSYFTISEEEASKWGSALKKKDPVVIRVKNGEQFKSGAYDTVKKTDEIIKPESIEVLNNGKWQPLKSKVESLGSTPEEVAARLEIKYNGINSMPESMKAKGFKDQLTFTDLQTKSTFTATSLDDVPKKLAEMRERFRVNTVAKEISTDPIAKDVVKLVGRETQDEALLTARNKGIGDVVDGEVETVVTETGKKAKAFSAAAAGKSWKSVVEGVDKGTVSPVEAVTELENVLFKLNESPSGVYKAAEKTKIGIEKTIGRIKKQANLLTGLAMFGVGAEAFHLFSPQEAEASMGTTAVKAAKLGGKALTAAKERLILELREKRHVVDKITADDRFFVGESGWQKGLGDSEAGGPKQVLEKANEWLRSGKHSVAGSLTTIRRLAMSPGQVFNEIVNTGNGIMNNPAVHKTSYMMAENMNITNGMKVVSNILKASGIKAAHKEVREMFKPLAPLMKEQVGFDYHTKRLGDLTEQLKVLSTKRDKTQAVNEAIADTKQQLAITRKYIEKYKPGLDKYHEEWEKTAATAAQKHSSVRVFLAADDNPGKWNKYPFMKGITLSQEEKLAVGRLKNQMAEYRVRLEQEGKKTRSGDFMHYTLHPEVSAKMMEDITGDITSAPYLKNYSRSLNSRPLMPEVYASMGHYVPDVEKRIQTQAYWKLWGPVRDRFRTVESVSKAFEALEKGTLPFANTWSNNATRWYTNFEVYKRLFGSASAGLKHLVKLTGDMSTLGVGNTLSAMPEALKGTSYRIAEITPFLKGIAEKHFKDRPEDFDKLRKSLFDSVVPVMNTRWRMMQMGFDDYESYFTKLGEMADKVNHAGGLWINLAELFDRGVSVTAGLNLAAKKGMTADQALYGIYDTILKNNFLGREFSPRWLRNPKVKAMLLFQTTPFKIMERRVVHAIKAGDSVRTLGKEIRKATKTPEGREKLLQDLRNLWKDMKDTEMEVKGNLILDSLRSNQDFYGNSTVSQFMKDVLITGAGTIAGGTAGMSLYHHFFHLPFMKSEHLSGSYGTLALSPGLIATAEGYDKWKNRDYEDDEFVTTKIIKEWLGKGGVFPDIVHKVNRINDGDIPDIYKDSKFKYLFAIPAKKDKYE